MTPPVLYGEHDLKIDEKNRLIIPAEVRRSIPSDMGEALFVGTGRNNVPWFWPEKYYEHLARKIPSSLMTKDDQLDLDQLCFALVTKVPWDKQGRIQLPEKTLSRAQIGKDVTLVGVRDHLELWSTATWESRRDDLHKRADEIIRRGSAVSAVTV